MPCVVFFRRSLQANNGHGYHYTKRLDVDSLRKNFLYNQPVTRVARCPVMNRTVRYLDNLSGQKFQTLPDMAVSGNKDPPVIVGCQNEPERAMGLA